MVDSRKKGARAELAARDLLRKATGLLWERTPSSGALGAQHMLKGDLYVPNEKNNYLIEVKHYKTDQLGSNILVNKDPNIFEWWDKAVLQAKQTNKSPLVMYKWDRSKWYIITDLILPIDKHITLQTGKNSGIIYSYSEFIQNFIHDNWCN